MHCPACFSVRSLQFFIPFCHSSCLVLRITLFTFLPAISHKNSCFSILSFHSSSRYILYSTSFDNFHNILFHSNSVVYTLPLPFSYRYPFYSAISVPYSSSRSTYSLRDIRSVAPTSRLFLILPLRWFFSFHLSQSFFFPSSLPCLSIHTVQNFLLTVPRPYRLV